MPNQGDESTLTTVATPESSKSAGDVPETDTDPESQLFEVLSSLASENDLMADSRAYACEDIPSFLWLGITTNRVADDAEEEDIDLDDLIAWKVGLEIIHKAVEELSPFEIHAVASQCVVFTAGSVTHVSLCVLLCCYALNKCPQPRIEQRWKRWQSLVFETIRMFQHYSVVEDGDLLSELVWSNHVIPSVLRVAEALPDEAYRIPLFAGLVGTTTLLVANGFESNPGKVIHYPGSRKDGEVDRISRLRTSVRQICDKVCFQESVISVLLQPWRSYSESFCDTEVDDEIYFLRRQNDLPWWTETAYCHERVTGMNTTWNKVGTSALALFSFGDRPLVLSPFFTWTVWFPHVSTLLQETSGKKQTHSRKLTMELFEQLLNSIEKHSLPYVRSNSDRPLAPFHLFQQLSNMLMLNVGGEAAPGVHDNPDKVAADKRWVSDAMKDLLQRYEPENQVGIIRKLIHDCPHPALQAKFMDLLRGILFEEASSDALWSYLNIYIKQLGQSIDSENTLLVKMDEIVERVELYVGSITMLQLWCMVRSEMPKKIKLETILSFHEALKGSLSRFMEESFGSPNEEYYRLYLLEGALQHLIDVLNKPKSEAAGKGGNEEPLSSLETTGTPRQVVAPSEHKAKQPQPIIVGDVGLFD